MEKISFKLDNFEGPLDLLLHLISKHKLNINDIEISKLLEQYMEYIENAVSHDLEIAGEFLEMAARLIYIKTMSLLPNPKEAEEIKKELQGTLIEYSQCKKAAERLKECFIGNEIFSPPQIKQETDSTYNVRHNPDELLKALQNMAVRNIKAEKKNMPVFNEKLHTIVKGRMVSVMSKVVHILRQLYSKGIMDMNSLYKGMTDRSERVATFLAVLELTKSGRIILNDDNTEIRFIGRQKLIDRQEQ
ncbi:MAG: segregation and condensation protein A [Oscillospiraceae bacterium]